MAPRVIASPGKPGGPHEHPCGHMRCYEMLQVAGAQCSKCGRPIGFDIEFDYDVNGKPQHVNCPKLEGEKA